MTLGLFGAALYGMRFVSGQQFFPSSGSPELLVDLQMPGERVDLRNSRDVSTGVDKLLKDDQADVDH